jgi:hypothetical protein
MQIRYALFLLVLSLITCGFGSWILHRSFGDMSLGAWAAVCVFYAADRMGGNDE